MADVREAQPKPGFFELSLLNNHFPQLHGVRVLAIVLVVQIHVTVALINGAIPLSPAFSRISVLAFYGMDLFFILSGFLIGTMILHSLEGAAGQRVLRFYARRSFRIFPLYYATLTALVFLNHPTPAQQSNLIYEYTYLTNYRLVLQNTVMMMWGWSLCVEEHFYLAVPLLMAVLYKLPSHRSRVIFLSALWASGLLVRVLIFAGHAGVWTEFELFQDIYIRTHTRFDTLVLGILLAYLQHHFRERVRTMLAQRWTRFVFWAISALSLAALMTPVSGNNYFITRIFCWGTLTSTMYLPFLLLLLNTETPLSAWLSQRWFLNVATLGYGIYLWHIPICEKIVVPMARVLFYRGGLSLTILWPLTVVMLMLLSIGFSYLTHIFIEKPALWLRDRVAK